MTGGAARLHDGTLHQTVLPPTATWDMLLAHVDQLPAYALLPFTCVV